MSNFVKLTRSNTSGDRPVTVNKNSITFFQWSDQYSVTRIHFATDGDNSVISVKETPEELEKLFK